MMAVRYMLVRGELYKRGQTLPLLKCVSKEGAYILREIYEEVYDSHSGRRVLAHKAIRMGSFLARHA